jgi:hypothetical protein
MIHYTLRCSQDHEFDGWFNDSAGFEKQAALGFVECPVCGDVKVTRALMAPAISTRPASAPQKEAPPPPAPTPAPRPAADAAPRPSAGAAVAGPMPAHVRAMLARMRAEVEKNCDYVGPAFAEEARRMHRGESEKHGIYGETSPDEAEALEEEGIAFSRIPWVPPADG